MFTKILVPVDGSSFGETALPLALSIARKSRASVVLFHAHTPLQSAYSEIQLFDSSLDEQMRKRERDYLEHLAQKINALKIPTSWANVEGEIAHSIRNEAQQKQVDLIVLSTHARGPMGRFWLGSVVDELLRDRDLGIPLLLNHPQEAEADFHQEYTFKNILVPLDGTPLAEQAIPHAKKLVGIMGSRFHLLRVVNPIIPVGVPPAFGSFGHVAANVLEQVETLHDQLRKEYQSYLDTVAQGLQSDGFEVSTHIVMDDQPGQGILNYAKSAGIDMIALGTHGRRGLARLLVGSVAQKVLRGATCPLLVHHPRG